METMYTRMMEDVAAQKGRNHEIAIEILTWASCSFRPLDLEELTVALSDNFTFHNIQSLRAAIAHICGNFVVIKNSKVFDTPNCTNISLHRKSRLLVPIDRGKSHALR